jgi:hypothetical protein
MKLLNEEDLARVFQDSFNKPKLAVLKGKDVNIVNGRYDYLIPYSEIKDPVKLAWWIMHLCEKRWFTKEHVYDMIKLSKVVTDIKP